MRSACSTPSSHRFRSFFGRCEACRLTVWGVIKQEIRSKR